MLFARLTTVHGTANACDGDVAVKKAERDLAVKGLRNCGRGLLAELKTLRAGDDGRESRDRPCRRRNHCCQ